MKVSKVKAWSSALIIETMFVNLIKFFFWHTTTACFGWEKSQTRFTCNLTLNQGEACTGILVEFSISFSV